MKTERQADAGERREDRQRHPRSDGSPFSAEEKIRIVLDGSRREDSIAESRHPGWSDYLRGGWVR